ncbi:MAG: 2,4-diaminopentanoate dehydrogenase [Bacilli bacterium]|jgi:4-hydroxy-tetrahydrodipicolinate reductase|nr:2,4-diaminopentanoate dehydrogenase [Bacilli bacterium]MDD3121027.1 2,4-diaminopentanoate dehydrogenase [Bacilli bacterium]MDD4063201.1 2,4-diaminopentanoate dehydrogenase [Bacilli bacterium]MDD4481841.1 2,4-diaminopentanoate dehydrogenase [Bacilli bacterium]MDD5182716.1 2,4-diaminopentanoate dehydrogenase [Bacilli bacterium]
MNNIKVIIWGFGAMGRGIAETLLSKKGVEIVGICDVNPALKNKKLSEIINCSRNSNVLIEEDIDNVLKHEADIVMLCTDSFVKGAYPKILKILSKKMNCISTAEQMAYSWASEKELSEEIDKVAKKNGVTVLGTGINPGFIMDYLVVALTGTMTDVNHIEAKRVNSLSPFGPTVMVEQGVGISLEEYKNRVSNNELAGHVGFLESVNMIAAALGVKLDDFKQQMSPIITDIERKSLYGKAKPGNLAGINMTGQGFVNGKQYINMIHPQQIEPEMVGIETGDYINIIGTPNINMSIKPEINGGIGTIAMCVNMIPHVINARAGLKTMIDLPVPRAIMGDMRDMIE